MIHIGFTGSRSGLTSAQADTVWALIHYRDFYGHHGDCVGGDAEFDALCKRAPNCRGIIQHPSTLANLRAHCAPRYPHDVVREPKDPIARDEDIVDETSLLIAAPKTAKPVLRSGTWTTIRYAQRLIHSDAVRGEKLGITTPLQELVVVLPNGAAIWDIHGDGWAQK